MKIEKIELYIGIYPDLGDNCEKDVIWCSADWSLLKIKNRFIKRNSEWKKNKIIVGKILL